MFLSIGFAAHFFFFPFGFGLFPMIFLIFLVLMLLGGGRRWHMGGGGYRNYGGYRGYKRGYGCGPSYQRQPWTGQQGDEDIRTPQGDAGEPTRSTGTSQGQGYGGYGDSGARTVRVETRASGNSGANTV